VACESVEKTLYIFIDKSYKNLHIWQRKYDLQFAGNVKSKEEMRMDKSLNSTHRPTAAIILAAGKGVRMQSQLPKVLNLLMGKPIVSYILDACQKAHIERTVVVVGYQADRVRQTLGTCYEYVEQTQQLGTGHAFLMAAEAFKGFVGDFLVLAGDTPFLTGHVLKKLIKHHQKTEASATLMTAIIDPPPPYGRIIRNTSGHILRIVEDNDASHDEKKIIEVNTSHYCFKAEEVLPLLNQLKTNNDQGEYYLTDVIELFAKQGKKIESLTTDEPQVLMGINTRMDLANAHTAFKEQITLKWMEQGVTIVDPHSVYIEPDVKIGRDTLILPFTSLLGKTSIGSGCVIGPQAKITDAEIGENCRIEFSVVENRNIETGAVIGPFASISGR